jgi:hypothetical protein
MDEKAMLGLHAAAIVIIVVLCNLRLYVWYLKSWQKNQLQRDRMEHFGAITFLLAVALALVIFGKWCSEGVYMVQWREMGADDDLIRKRLLTVDEWKVRALPALHDGGTRCTALEDGSMTSAVPIPTSSVSHHTIRILTRCSGFMRLPSWRGRVCGLPKRASSQPMQERIRSSERT